MTKKEIDQLSRSWIGHLATNIELRKQFETLTHDRAPASVWVDLINQTVNPKTPCTVDDLEAIQEHIRDMYDPRKQLLWPGGQFSILQVHGRDLNT